MKKSTLGLVALLLAVPAMADDAAVDAIVKFLNESVVDRKLNSSQTEPKVTDPASGETTQRSFERETSYGNVKKTDFGLTFEYNVAVHWKTHKLDAKGEKVGKAFDLKDYNQKARISLNSYPKHSKLYGIYQPADLAEDGKTKEVGPSDIKRMTVYLKDGVLHIDGQNLYPTAQKVGGQASLLTWNWYEKLWEKGGKLQRTQLWRDALVDAATLQPERPFTEEKELYSDSEK